MGLHNETKTWLPLQRSRSYDNSWRVTLEDGREVVAWVGGGVRIAEVNFCLETGEMVIKTEPYVPAPAEPRTATVTPTQAQADAMLNQMQDLLRRDTIFTRWPGR